MSRIFQSLRTKLSGPAVVRPGSKSVSAHVAVGDSYAQAIRSLPSANPLSRESLLTDTFLLHQQDALTVYYAPFDYVNRRARIAIVGITPGWHQMETAFRVTRRELLNGLGFDEATRIAKREASFAGTMRRNLVAMLDEIGVARMLGIPSTSSLFEDRAEFAHTTSALRYPVFVNGNNYTGHAPELSRSPFLLEFVRTMLLEELEALPTALVVPLGNASGSAVQDLVEIGRVDPQRCLFGFPHPSGANGHRARQFADRRAALERQVLDWFGVSTAYPTLK